MLITFYQYKFVLFMHNIQMLGRHFQSLFIDLFYFFPVLPQEPVWDYNNGIIPPRLNGKVLNLSTYGF